MWPILTLSFLLQLTDEEQLFAQQAIPIIQPVQVEQTVAPAVPVEPPCEAVWPDAKDSEV